MDEDEDEYEDEYEYDDDDDDDDDKNEESHVVTSEPIQQFEERPSSFRQLV